MADGDLIVADYQYEIRTTLFGYGSDYRIDHDRAARFTPIGELVYKLQRVNLTHDDGAYGGNDRLGTLTFTLPFYFQGTPANAFLAMQTVRTAWAPSTSDITLYGRVPGIGKFYVSGRPIDLDENTQDAEFGRVLWTAVFEALDPTITEV